MAINAQWHEEHRLGRGAKLAERIRWHVAHAKACGCRPIPASVAKAIAAAGAARDRKRPAKRRE